MLPWLSPQGDHQHEMLTQSCLHHHRDPLSPVLKNNSWLIPVPPALRAHQLSSPQKCSAVAYPQRDPESYSFFFFFFVMEMLCRLPWAASNWDWALQQGLV